jgi:hypothetical protein
MKNNKYIFGLIVFACVLFSGEARAENSMYSDCTAMGAGAKCVAAPVCPSGTKEVGSTGAFGQCGSDLCCVGASTATSASSDSAVPATDGVNVDVSGNVSVAAATPVGANTGSGGVVNSAVDSAAKKAEGALGAAATKQIDKLTGKAAAAANVVPGSGAASGVSVVTFENPLKFGTISEAIGALLGNLQGLIALLAIIFIVIGGVMYVISMGEPDMMKKGKNTITAALIGLAITLAAPTFLKTIKTVLGGGGAGTPDDIVNSALTINQIAIRVLNFLLSIVGILAIISLVIGGAYYLTAYGDEGRMKKGKEIATASVMGIIIVLAALIIVRQVANLLGAI